jgi:acyl carrier protein
LSIDWGAWAEVGMAAQLVRTQRTQLAAQGMRAIAPAQGVAALAHLLGQPTPQVGVIPVNWATVMDNGAFSNPFFAAFRKQAPTAAQHTVNATSQSIRQQLALATPDQAHRLLLSYVQREVAQALQMQDLPAAQAGFNELGMDSLTTIDLRRRLEKGLQTTLPSTIAFEYPTVEALAAYLSSVLVVAPHASDSLHDQKQEPSADPAGQALGDLSEAELDDLLEQELAFLKEE